MYEKTSRVEEVYSRWGTVVEEVRTVFERMNDTMVYIPDLKQREVATIMT